MTYVLRHKEHRTYYCFDKIEKMKFYKLGIEHAYKFNYPSSAEKIRTKMKHPDNWEVIGVREHTKRKSI